MKLYNKDLAIPLIKEGSFFFVIHKEKNIRVGFYNKVLILRTREVDGEILKLTFNSTDETLEFVNAVYGLDNFSFYYYEVTG